MRRLDRGDERVAIAVVGFGRFGRWHAERLRNHPCFALACVVDPNADARARAVALGFPAVRSIAEIPAHVRAATIVTPAPSHAEVASALMRRGLHVLVEKPLATSEDEIDALLQVAAETGCLLYTGHIERFNAVLPREWARAVPAGLTFRRRSRLNGSGRAAILDLMVHDLDLAAYLFDLPADAGIEVARAELKESEIEVDVTIGSTSLRFHAGYGSTDSDAQILLGHGVADADRRTVSLTGIPQPGREDALTRQFSAFHDALCGRPTSLADATAGAVAARRALAILAAL